MYKESILNYLPKGAIFKKHEKATKLFVRGKFIEPLNLYGCHRLGDNKEVKFFKKHKKVFVRI